MSAPLQRSSLWSFATFRGRGGKPQLMPGNTTNPKPNRLANNGWVPLSLRRPPHTCDPAAGQPPKCFMRLFAEMLRSGFRYLFALGPTVPSLFRLASVEKTRKNAHSCGRQKKKLWHISCLLQELFLGQRIRVAQVLTFPGRRFAWQTKRERLAGQKCL